MAEELGRIEKPEARQFESKRNLYLVPLIFSADDAPADYAEKFARYWEQVGQHIAKMEPKISPVCHVYHESIALAGEEGLKLLEKLSPASHQIAQDKCQSGAIFEATEAKELADEAMDWERFLLMGCFSRKVADKVSEFYLESLKKRYEHIANVIDETLKPGEVGVLVIREGHMIQFPPDVEVFSVAPPALDDIHRWLRDQQTKKKPEGTE
ncbi:hypothetical protein ACFLRP_00560 [Bacteroidota bacterium]